MDQSGQYNQQFNVAPFQRVEINIGNIDRSQGVVIPELEGYGFYVERSDYPVFLNVVNQTPLLQASIIARDGVECDTPFKGLILTHPLINTTMVLSIIIFKTPCARYTNQLGNAISRLLLSTRIIGNTLTQQLLGIYVPPGVRFLSGVQVSVTGTTATSAFIQAYGVNGGAVVAPTNLTAIVAGAPVVYNVASQGGVFSGAFRATAFGGGGFTAEFPYSLVIPTQINEVQISINGSGLTGVNNVTGYWQ